MRTVRVLIAPIALLMAFFLAASIPAAGPPAKHVLPVGYEEYRTVQTAVRSRISASVAPTPTQVQPGYLGLMLDGNNGKMIVASVERNSPAMKAGLATGDVLLRVDGKVLREPGMLAEEVRARGVGAKLPLVYARGDSQVEVTVALAATSRPLTADRTKGKGKNWDDRAPRLFRKPVYNLAVVQIEYPDVVHSAKISSKDWADALFSTGTYNKKSVSGDKVYGSMNDYYLEQSCGNFRVGGKVFDWVKVKRKRAEYSNDTNRAALLTEALDLILERDGAKALDAFDGIFFMYAGERFTTRRGGLYWPHRASVSHKGKRWSYFICPEGGSRMASISVITHEFGHMLGLPDLYARPEVPGQEGLGVWCTMSVGHGRDGKPLHFSAWCKEQLGWLKPTVIDPRDRQKLILGPIHASRTECYKVPLRADGSEYLLLENRQRFGFDRDLPAEGLLIWRVFNGRPILEESHGVDGPSGPTVHLNSVPYPSDSNNSFTPFTTPSSKSLKGGGFPVYIHNIEKLKDGRIAFHIGYEYF